MLLSRTHLCVQTVETVMAQDKLRARDIFNRFDQGKKGRLSFKRHMRAQMVSLGMQATPGQPRALCIETIVELEIVVED